MASSESTSARTGRWLCEEHKPNGLLNGDLLGARVAKIVGGQLLFVKGPSHAPIRKSLAQIT